MIIDGVKYSCDACTKGHRQANCTHADRPLTEVRKRGRPQTACAQCRIARTDRNSHRTCTHIAEKEKLEAQEPLIKTLPNGCKDLTSLAIVRRSSSTKSRSSASSAPSTSRVPTATAASSTSIALEEELATVGRKKSLSRPPSSRSRGSSVAGQRKASKPHDLAHGHLADHPTHVSSTYSPYPHHAPHHHHHPTREGKEKSHSPLATGAATASTFEEEPQTPALPLLPVPNLTSYVSTPSHLPQPPRLAPVVIAPAPLPSAPPAVDTRKTEPPMSTADLVSAFFFRGFPAAATGSSEPPSVLAKPPVAAPDVTEASTGAALPATSPDLFSQIPPLASFPYEAAFSLPPSLPHPATSLPVEPPPSQPLYSEFTSSSYGLDPSASHGLTSLAPMYGDEDSQPISFFSEPEPLPSTTLASGLPSDLEGTYASFAASFPRLGGNGEIDSYSFAPTPASRQDSFSPPVPPGATPSGATSLPYPPSTAPGVVETPLPPPNPAVYGYPLQPVQSHTSYTSYNSYNSYGSFASNGTGGGAAAGPSAAASVYSGYESATGGAASALERLDLDFEAASSISARAVPLAAPAYGSSSSSVAAGGGGQIGGAEGGVGPEDPLSQTDLDGILEWLASSNAGAGSGTGGESSSTSSSARLSPHPPPLPSSSSQPHPAPPSLSSFSSFSSSFSDPSFSHPSSGFASNASSARHSPLLPDFPTFSIPTPPPPAVALPLPDGAQAAEQAPIAVDEAGYEEDDEGGDEPDELERGGGGGLFEPRFGAPAKSLGGSGGGGGGLTFAEPPGLGTSTVRARRKKDPALEMLRTATITCAEQSLAVAGDDSWGDRDGEDDDEGGEEEEGSEEEAGRLRRADAFAARFGTSAFDDDGGQFSLEENELEGFGIDEDWLRRAGTGEVHFDWGGGGGEEFGEERGGRFTMTTLASQAEEREDAHGEGEEQEEEDGDREREEGAEGRGWWS
ncbi:hypothetical protein JCM11641_003396 [Rhodosporidiobolus odoratus]